MSLGWPPSEILTLHRKEFTTSYSKQKQVYLKRYTLREWIFSESKRPQGAELSVFMDWVISQANKQENYSNYFG